MWCVCVLSVCLCVCVCLVCLVCALGDLQESAVVMCAEAVEVVHEALQLLLLLPQAARLALLPLGSCLLRALVLVAAVVAAGALAVLAPHPHAHPAELVLALLTRHMVAALVLLDDALATGALFRVLEEPVQVGNLKSEMHNTSSAHHAAFR